MSDGIKLLADTNLFFECQSIESLPWDLLDKAFVSILICNPVISEIDSHKKKNGRTRRRATATYQRIREAVEQKREHIIIRESNPQVIMRLIINVSPLSDLSDKLDYSNSDDKIVGILASLNKAENQRVILFTHDTGPAAKAQSLSLPFMFIPDDWLRHEEQTVEQKEIHRLKGEIEKYSETEPHFDITCDFFEGGKSGSLTQEIVEPLSNDEIDKLIDMLESKFPCKTDFTPPESQFHPISKSETVVETRFFAPCKEKIDEYIYEEYPKWIYDCRKSFESWHERYGNFKTRLITKWEVSNIGVRPAKKVRIQFDALGAIGLKRVEFNENTRSSTAKLDLPPVPPRFTERQYVTNIGDDGSTVTKQVPESWMNRNASGIGSALASMQLGAALFNREILEPDFQPINRMRHQHDEEGFYYHDWYEGDIVKSGSLTCGLWRHESNSEIFEFEIVFESDSEVNASVACYIHAENLTVPARQIYQISRKVEKYALFDDAVSCINEL